MENKRSSVNLSICYEQFEFVKPKVSIEDDGRIYLRTGLGAWGNLSCFIGKQEALDLRNQLDEVLGRPHIIIRYEDRPTEGVAHEEVPGLSEMAVV